MSAPQHIITLFDAVSARSPQAPALERADETGALLERLSYAELQARSLELSAELNTSLKGAVRAPWGLTVALCLPKGGAWVSALLACWRAGVVAVLLSPELAHKRRQEALRDAQAAALFELNKGALTLRRLDHSLHQHLKGEARASHTDTTRPLDIDAPAYLIYTSGSTGRPKGVLASHRGLPLVLTQQIEAFGYTPASRSLWLLSQVFDASLSDVGVSLLSGGTLVISEALSTPGAHLMSLLGSLKITHLDLPPALLSLYEPSEAPQCLEHLTIGGEAAPVERVRRWAAHVRVVNVYGPTEATICTSLGRCDPELWRDADIGAPLSGVTYALMSPQGSLTPLTEAQEGEEGELWISGETLAIGYTDPTLTEARFVWREGARWYRTGDLVRSVEGRAVFLGRLDRQLKVAGSLIAPEEVEAALLAHPLVREVAVFGVGGPNSAQASALCGALSWVLEAERPKAAEEAERFEVLEQWLSERLPRFMWPSRWRALSELPRLSSHKPDYPSLRALFQVEAQADAHSNTQAQAGRLSVNELTEELCALWGEVTGVEEVNEGDDFFALGGDSLALIELVTSAQARGLSITLSLLNSAPTPRGAARALLAGADGGEARSVTELTPYAALPPWLEAQLSSPLHAQVPKSDPPSPPRFLITGATGHLGAHLTLALLNAHPSAQVIGLVRARGGAQAALSRLKAALSRLSLSPHQLDQLVAEGRLSVVVGDVSVRRFGLNESDWGQLKRRVTRVVHCAAEVHMTRTYESLAPVNVGGLLHTLELTSARPVTPLLYCSTLSVFVATDQHSGQLKERDELLNVGRVYGGYAQSKWVAERLLRAPALKGHPISVFRLGLLTASAQGVSAPADFLGQLIGGLLELGGAPTGPREDLAVDMTPTDYAAEVMAHVGLSALAERPQRETFHVANSPGVTLKALLSHLRRAGLPLDDLTPSQWEALQANPARLSPKGRLALMALCRLSHEERFELYRSVDLLQATQAHFCDNELRAALRSLGRDELAPPPPSRALSYLNLDQFGLDEALIKRFEALPLSPPPAQPTQAPLSARALRRLCVIGPESAGKTTLCARLSEALTRRGHMSVIVPEAARLYLEALARRHGRSAPPLQAAHFLRIASAQALLDRSLSSELHDWVISDTSALLTSVWSEALCAPPLPDLRVWCEAERFDLYLLLRPDLPWEGDEVRYQPAQEERQRFFERCEELLKAHGSPYVVVGGAGEARLTAALEALHVLAPAGM